MSFFRLIPLILVLLCITLTGSAPLPGNNPSLITIERRDESISSLNLAERTLSDLSDRDIDQDNLFPRDVASRSLDTLDASTLVRRKSVDAKIKDGFKKAGNAIKKGFQKAGEGIKKVANKAGEGIKTAAKKVGQFAKDTGAKIAKVGLQAVSTVQSIAAKAAKFIPVIGKPLSAGLSAESAAIGLAASKIPAKLDSKSEKAIKVMETIKHPLKGAGGALLNALRRDIDVDVVLFERDTVDLDEELFARSADEDLFARFLDESADQDIFGREYD